jgi:predicted transcriptional regulator
MVEPVERMVNYDGWFLRELDKGLAAADRGELVDRLDVRKMIDERLPLRLPEKSQSAARPQP